MLSSPSSVKSFQKNLQQLILPSSPGTPPSLSLSGYARRVLFSAGSYILFSRRVPSFVTKLRQEEACFFLGHVQRFIDYVIYKTYAGPVEAAVILNYSKSYPTTCFGQLLEVSFSVRNFIKYPWEFNFWYAGAMMDYFFIANMCLGKRTVFKFT